METKTVTAADEMKTPSYFWLIPKWLQEFEKEAGYLKEGDNGEEETKTPKR